MLVEDVVKKYMLSMIAEYTKKSNRELRLLCKEKALTNPIALQYKTLTNVSATCENEVQLILNLSYLCRQIYKIFASLIFGWCIFRQYNRSLLRYIYYTIKRSGCQYILLYFLHFDRIS